MNPNKALWEKGDFTRIAATMRESGQAVVRSFDLVVSIFGAMFEPKPLDVAREMCGTPSGS
jgi:hypothetical protein